MMERNKETSIFKLSIGDRIVFTGSGRSKGVHEVVSILRESTFNGDVVKAVIFRSPARRSVKRSKDAPCIFLRNVEK